MAVEATKKPALNEIMGDLLASQKHTDCTFIFLDEDLNHVKELDFGAHAVVLAAGSDVFEAMLFGQLKEKTQITIEGIKQPIFKKLIEVIYQLDVKVRSPEEARDLFVAAQKYNVKDGIELARDFMLKNCTKESADIFFTAGLFHDDKEVIDNSWAVVRNDILDILKTRGFFENKLVEVPEAFEIEAVREEKQISHAFEISMKTLKDEKGLKKRIGLALGLVQFLTSKAALVLQSILADESLKLECNIVWKPEDGSLEPLSKVYTTLYCIRCEEFVNPLVAGHDCYNETVKNIYLKYAHTNLNDYEIADVQTLYTELKQYFPK